MKRQISVLDQSTIDKIAAGEVVERPSSVVKELVENAIDAGASAITVEIKEGGTTFIRITDNGAGIDKEQVPLAFLRHATSKIRKVEDLSLISSLGFRGEALSSIAAVSRVELITKPHEQLIGVRYQIEGGMEKGMEEIGAPDGTTFLIRDLFYNTPARAKFLKTPTTEAGYISSFIEQLALSHPHISFKYMQNGQTKLHTSGNNNLKEAIYQIYGRDITRELIEIHTKDRDETIRIDGFIVKPVISRGNRNFENYYVNGRYVKSKIVTKAVEDAYHTFMMQHKYPFTCLHIQIKGSDVDVNVHPTKMEVRFSNQELVYRQIYQAILQGLQHKELIPQVTIGKERPAGRPSQGAAPEPFEVQRRQIEQPRGYQMQRKVQPGELKSRVVETNTGSASAIVAPASSFTKAPSAAAGNGSMVREQGTGFYGEKRETGSGNENLVRPNLNLQVEQPVSKEKDKKTDSPVAIKQTENKVFLHSTDTGKENCSVTEEETDGNRTAKQPGVSGQMPEQKISAESDNSNRAQNLQNVSVQPKTQETSPAPGFATTEEVQEFTFTAESADKESVSYEFTFEDEPTVFEFTKTSLTDGKEVEGAKLAVTDENGEIIEEWVSGKEPHIIRELVVGKTYTLTETLPAPGYVTAESIRFTVEDTAKVQKVEMKDDVTKVEISKTDISGKELPGASPGSFEVPRDSW